MLFFYLYLVLGLLLGICIDRSEMKKHVPYGHMPSIYPLAMIRKAILVVCVLFGAPLAATALISTIIKEIMIEWRMWRTERHLRCVCKQLGLNFDAIVHEIQTKREKQEHDGNPNDRAV